MSKHPICRACHLNFASPVKLNIIFMITGSIQDEIALHKLFKSDRIHGEWFKFIKLFLFS